MRWFLVGAVLAAGCGGAPPAKPAAPPAAASGCLADRLGPLHNVDQIDTACLGENHSCKQACQRGDAPGCMHHAFALQRSESHEEAVVAFARACELGLAIGCTNLGADLWLVRQPAPPAEVACARRLFKRACDVREPFGCGMLGRMLADEAKTPETKETARRFFDQTCSDLGSMTCRMYALHLENGDLGAFEPATVSALMQRACDTGDQDACGHATASETFR